MDLSLTLSVAELTKREKDLQVDIVITEKYKADDTKR